MKPGEERKQTVSQTLGEGRQKLARIFSEPHQAYLLTQGTS